MKINEKKKKKKQNVMKTVEKIVTNKKKNRPIKFVFTIERSAANYINQEEKFSKCSRLFLEQ